MTRTYLSLRPCPICEEREGYRQMQLAYTLFDDLEISGLKTLVQCHTCGMLYDDIQFSNDQLRAYYRRNEHYAASGTGGTGGASQDNLERYDRILDLLKADESGVLVDYGCGQGGFISRCLENNLKAVGIEASAKSRATAHNAGLQVYASLESFIQDNSIGNIQAVIFSHVLEHLIHPKQLIREFAEYADAALVYIEVPDADSYLLAQAVRWQEMYFEHLSHFCKHSLMELAKRSSVEILKEATIPFSRLQKTTRCRYLLGKFSSGSKMAKVSQRPQTHSISEFPAIPFKTIPDDNRPIALWGVSQYAMLLLGSWPGLRKRIKHLFDNSPAKVGRRIKGILIEPSSGISSLSPNHLLLLPKSNYLHQMLNQLASMEFNGQVVEV